MLKKNKLFSVILAFALSAAVAVSFTGCSSNDNTTSSSSSTSVTESSSSEESSTSESSEASSDASAETSSETSSETSAEEASGENASASSEGTTIGEGETEFVFEVVLDDGSTTLFNVKTDETTVGAALLDLGLIAGDESEYGLYVKTVNGVTADYDTDGKYWAFYIDGEYASTGVDSTDIVPGSTYSFKIEA